jgi:HlyD family secretion protein
MTPKKRAGTWKWVLGLVLLGAGFGGWYWYRGSGKETAIEYKTATLSRGDLTQVVTANGQINAVTNVTVGSQVSGIITGIKADFNSRVTNGQVIAQIDPSTYQQNINQAEAELANAEAGLEMADLNLRRAQALRTNDLISASEYDQTLVNLHQAQAVVKTRNAALRKAQVDLERTTIYAPIDGLVISRVVDVGQTVAASFNAPTLFTIANDLRNMRIEAMVSEADVGGVQEGQAVSFTVDAFPGRKFRGQATQVRYAPVTNQNVVNYITVVNVNNDDLKLRPGMTANASIVIAERNNVLRIPNAALRFRPPEGAKIKGGTNAPAGAANAGGTNKPVLTAVATTGPRGEGGGGNREETRRRFENMSPEEREQMRERMRARFGEGGPPGAGGRGMGGSRGGPDGPTTRTVYLIDKEAVPDKAKPAGIAGLVPGLPGAAKPNPQLKPVSIKTGISDGSFTEVLEGLQEGDVVVTGLDLPATATTLRPPTGAPPFGGPPFGGGMRR